MMTMNGTLHPKGGFDRLYVPRVKGERRLIKSEENSMWWYIKNARKELLVSAKTVGVVKTDETVSKREFRKRWTDGEVR